MSLNSASRLYRTEYIRSTLAQEPATPPSFASTHVDLLAGKILSLEERIESFAADAAKRYKQLKDTTKRIRTDITESREEREKDFEHKVAELLAVEKTFDETIETERVARKQEENKLFRVVDENYKLFKLELQREAEARCESAAEIDACLNTDIPRLVEGIKQECSDREETDQNILKKFQDEFTELGKEVQAEKTSREETEQAIFDMLRDVVERVKREIEIERRERQSAEESLLTLLEETCVKLSNATNTRA